MTNAAVRTLWTLGAVAALAACRGPADLSGRGTSAPELSGSTVDGQPVSLSAERGKAVAVVFFADWCPYCRALYSTEREVATRMSGHPFTLIGVIVDGAPADIRDAIRREGITWPLIVDSGRHSAAAWGVSTIPVVFVIDADGMIRASDLSASQFLPAVDALIAETEHRAAAK